MHNCSNQFSSPDAKFQPFSYHEPYKPKAPDASNVQGAAQTLLRPDECAPIQHFQIPRVGALRHWLEDSEVLFGYTTFAELHN